MVLHPKPRPAHPGASAFTLIELLIVLFIMSVLMIAGSMNFAKFFRTSRVDQAAQAVFAALWHARAEAQRWRCPVAVFYGDSKAHHSAAVWQPPLSDVLPKPGTIEVWTVKSAGTVSATGDTGDDDDYLSMMGGAMQPPMPYCANNTLRAWYPFHVRERLLTSNPITFPAGVRIVTGYLNHYEDWYHKDYRRNSVGELKRHCTVYGRQGGMISWNSFSSQSNAYNYVLIFDEATGDHVVIQAGSWKTTTRPRLLATKIKKIQYNTPINSLHNLPKMIDKYPSNWSVP